MLTCRTTLPALILSLALGWPTALFADKAKDLAEAAENFKKGMIFYQQGAYKEAAEYIRKAEKKDKDNPEYMFAIADVYLKLHRPDDAMERYEKMYKKDPTNARALFGIAATFEEMQDYRDAVKMWRRYTRMDLPAEQKAEGLKRLRAARELFANNYEIAENPAGGAENLLAPDQELKLGFQTAQSAAMETPILFDPEINIYVRTLCENLVKHAKGFPTSYKLIVFDTSEVNAFATPGYIGVNRGILETADNESQIAGVLSHEIGHSVAHHVAKAITKQYKDQKALEEMEQQEGKLAAVLAAIMGIGNQYSALAFSRQEESQADRLGVHISFDSGFDPMGLVGMFRKFESMSPSSRSWWDKINRTHPMSIDRINDITEYCSLLPEVVAVNKKLPEFEAMKARLKKLPPAPDAKGILR